MTDLSTSACADDTTLRADEPSDLDVAICVGQRMLTAYLAVDRRDVDALNQAYGGVSEALYILLRALGVEPMLSVPANEEPLERCPAAHPEDPTPCGGPVIVTVLDATNAGADGCEHHAARLLASLDRGRVYGHRNAPAGTAIRVFTDAQHIRPFPWIEDAPRTEPSQLSRDENRRGGEQA